MRLTAAEWVDRLRAVLGGAAASVEQVADVQPVRQVTAPYARDDGPNVSSSVEFDSRTFQITALSQYVQIVPRGYYDSVLITVCNNDTTTISIPILCAMGRVQKDEGRYTMSGTQGAFLLANPPIRAVPAQDNENSLEINLPLTNAPLIVWCDDGVNPSSTGTFPLTITLMTRRH